MTAFFDEKVMGSWPLPADVEPEFEEKKDALYFLLLLTRQVLHSATSEVGTINQFVEKTGNRFSGFLVPCSLCRTVPCAGRDGTLFLVQDGLLVP